MFVHPFNPITTMHQLLEEVLAKDNQLITESLENDYLRALDCSITSQTIAEIFVDSGQLIDCNQSRGIHYNVD